MSPITDLLICGALVDGCVEDLFPSNEGLPHLLVGDGETINMSVPARVT